MLRKLIIFFSVVLVSGLGITTSVQASPSQSQLAPYIEQFKQRITEYQLDNGMKFIILPDHEAPVISFVTYVDVGAVNEEKGETGAAHFLEHLAFKGTKKIGTTNYEQEKEVLEELDQVFQKLQKAKENNNQAQIKKLKKQFKKLKAKAAEYVKSNEFGEIVQTNGGVGLNASTSADYTNYFYNFPANKLELWMSLESERFLEPVFRKFYEEKEVILEERRLRTENSPVGKMIEELMGTAFTTHPYQHPVIGYEQDIKNMTRQDIRDFFNTYYVPQKYTFAVVGDVDPQQVKALADAYFGRFSKQPDPPKVTAVEPPQKETREVEVTFPTEPWYFEAYHRPDLNDDDHVVYEVITHLLSQGRLSRLYQSLVQEKQVALTAKGISSFPGNKFPNLVLFYALTTPNHSLEDVSQALRQELEKLKTEPVTTEELERVKTQIQSNLLRSLDSNRGMARRLAEYDAKTGSWENLFSQLEEIKAVTADDIQRVAQETFTPDNRTIGRLLSEQN